MKQIVVKLTEEQQALIKLSATAIDAKASKPIIEAMDAKASKPIIEAMDATDSVEIDFNELLESKEEQNQIVVAMGLMAIGKIANDLNV